MDETIDAGRGCLIPVSEIQWRFSPSGGPGGQHANRSNTRVEARLDLASSPSLTDEHRARLIARFGDELVVVVDDERSQLRNRAIALERLRDRIAPTLIPPKRRRPTKPSRGATERRLESKKQRTETKRLRRRPGDW